MKNLLCLILLSLSPLLQVSCSSTGDSQLLSALAQAGLVYVQSSGKLKPADQVYVDAAAAVLKDGKLDQAALARIIREAAIMQLQKQGITDDQRAEINEVLIALETGKLDKAALFNLAATAARAYAASNGIPPEQTNAVLALVRALAANA